ncbi:MAG: DUF493 domain-containing protein [Flavobacteriaceae bacterium]|nr:DUF493 domain-containing protein [Flavobacteriaceae bacterium]
MEDKNNPDEFYKKLKGQLEDTTTFPTSYMYKFIVPTSEARIEEVMAIFDNLGAIIDTKKSKTGKYTSITIQLVMQDADSIILKYKEVSKIDGVISL